MNVHHTIWLRSLATAWLGLGLPIAGLPAAETAELPKSLFVSPASLASVPDATVRQWFDHIVAAHRAAGSPQRIDSLVVSEVADVDPEDLPAGARILATPPAGVAAEWCHPKNHKLDVIAPYFKNFDAVYLGTVHVHWPGPDSPYDRGIQDAEFREQNLRLSQSAMERLHAVYPDLKFHWYITYEANLNYFPDAKIRDAYAEYVRELCCRMKAHRDADILWSPNFWTKYETTDKTRRAKLANSLKDFFAKVPITDVHFQDFLGGSSASGSHRFTTRDVKGYYDMLAALKGPRVRVNAELFVVTDRRSFSLAPMSPADYAQRMQDYAKLQLPLGGCWEIRYWYPAHQGTCPVKPMAGVHESP